MNIHIEERFEAGIVLEGWEVKSLRDGKIQLKESYVTFTRGEAWLERAHISPLLSASTHVIPNAIRRKKLLLNRHELNKLTRLCGTKKLYLHPIIDVLEKWPRKT